MDLNDHALDYLAQARWHHFRFQLGEMRGLDRTAKTIRLAPLDDRETGVQVMPERDLAYDTLVMAVGSHTNDFGTAGAAEHAIALDTPEQAERFRSKLLNACLRVDAQGGPKHPWDLHIAIIGAGATGVELAAELHNSTRELVSFGLDAIVPERDVRIAVIEAAPRVLPALPERLSESTRVLLDKLNVAVLTGERVTEVGAHGVKTLSGREVPAELTVWAAGIKAPDFLKDIAGLETNRLNQLVVQPTLQTTRDAAIFALGDCAACVWPEKQGFVPPRAQAAHQQASHLVKQIVRVVEGGEPRAWTYRDFGSLVSLGHYSTVGSLMGGITRGSLMIEGWFASLMYKSLYKMHEYALHGFSKVALDSLARLITRRTEPHVKLH
jgi:NADH dehydrogenase